MPLRCSGITFKNESVSQYQCSFTSDYIEVPNNPKTKKGGGFRTVSCSIWFYPPSLSVTTSTSADQMRLCPPQWHSCNNVVSQQVVSLHLEKNESWCCSLQGSFLTIFPESLKPLCFFKFHSVWWKMSSLITSEIHLHFCHPQIRAAVMAAVICQHNSCPWLLGICFTD